MKLTKRQVWQIVGACALCAVMIVALILGLYYGLGSMSKQINSPTASVDDNSPLVIDCESTSDIMLTSGVATTASDGITTQTITASIVADDVVVDKTLSWTASFKNANSNWASGKSVSDYVTLTPNDTTLSCDVKCLSAFGEQIIVTATAKNNSSAHASATVDYIKRIEKITFNSLNLTTSGQTTQKEAYTNTIKIVYSSSELDSIGTYGNNIKYTVTYGTGTISGTFTVPTVTLTNGDDMDTRIRGFANVGSTTYAKSKKYTTSTASDVSAYFDVTIFNGMSSGGDGGVSQKINDFIITQGSSNGTNGGIAGATIVLNAQLSYNGTIIQSMDASLGNFFYYNGFLSSKLTTQSVSIDNSILVF